MLKSLTLSDRSSRVPPSIGIPLTPLTPYGSLSTMVNIQAAPDQEEDLLAPGVEDVLPEADEIVTPYLLKVSLLAGCSGLLFGWDTGIAVRSRIRRTTSRPRNASDLLCSALCFVCRRACSSQSKGISVTL